MHNVFRLGLYSYCSIVYKSCLLFYCSSLTGEDYELEMVADVGLTYEQLRSIIDSLLIESGYYQCQQQSSSASSASAVR